MTWPKKATNVLNLSLFFERHPKDRVKEQYPFFYSRTGDDMFFFRFLFLKLTFDMHDNEVNHKLYISTFRAGRASASRK